MIVLKELKCNIILLCDRSNSVQSHQPTWLQNASHCFENKRIFLTTTKIIMKRTACIRYKLVCLPWGVEVVSDDFSLGSRHPPYRTPPPPHQHTHTCNPSRPEWPEEVLGDWARGIESKF